MTTWNSLPDAYLSQRILFDVQEQGTKFSSRKILGNVDPGSHYDYIFF